MSGWLFPRWKTISCPVYWAAPGGPGPQAKAWGGVLFDLPCYFGCQATDNLWLQDGILACLLIQSPPPLPRISSPPSTVVVTYGYPPSYRQCQCQIRKNVKRQCALSSHQLPIVSLQVQRSGLLVSIPARRRATAARGTNLPMGIDGWYAGPARVWGRSSQSGHGNHAWSRHSRSPTRTRGAPATGPPRTGPRATMPGRRAPSRRPARAPKLLFRRPDKVGTETCLPRFFRAIWFKLL